MTLKNIGKTDTDFTEGRVYEAEKTYDSYYKECYTIYDDGEDWYVYSTEFGYPFVIVRIIEYNDNVILYGKTGETL